MTKHVVARALLGALLIIGAVACSDADGTTRSSGSVGTVGDSSAGVSLDLGSAPPVTEAAPEVLGWTTARYAVTDDPAKVAEAVQTRLRTAGVDGEARVDGVDVVVEAHHVTPTDGDILLHAVMAGPEQVYVRTVGSPCQQLVLPISPTTDPGGSAAPAEVVDASGLPVLAADPTSRQFLPVAGPAPRVICDVEPTDVTGVIFDGAAPISVPGGGTGLLASLRPAADGEDGWNEIARLCYDRQPVCGTGQLAFEVGGILVTVATVQTPEFGGSVQISGAFTPATAAVVAAALNSAAPSPDATVLSYTFTPA